MISGAAPVRRIHGKRCATVLERTPADLLDDAPLLGLLSGLVPWLVPPPLPAARQPQAMADLRLGGHRNERIGEAAHPGPRQRNLGRPSEVSVCSLNVGGMTGAWRWLNSQSCLRYLVVLLQEYSASDAEHPAFASSAARLGYVCFRTPSVGPKGGAALLVSNKLRSRAYKVWSAPGGQAVFAVIHGTLMGSIYVAHRDEAEDFLRDVLDVVLTAGQSWFLAGDWNCLPSENWVSSVLLAEGAHLVFPDGLTATCWEGSRLIDYGLTSLPGAV